jgi:hypothetical protein
LLNNYKVFIYFLTRDKKIFTYFNNFFYEDGGCF